MKTMTYLLGLFLMFGATVSYANGQKSAAEERHQFVVMPRDLALPLLVSQPDAPLEFVETKLLVNVSSGIWVPSFRIRNRGTKPICTFNLASAGSGGWEWKADGPSHYLMPGQVTALEEDSRDEIVPLTDTLRDRLRLRGPMKGMIALLVVRVQYADGSEFRESGYEGLDEYLTIVRGVLSDPRLKAQQPIRR